jgi:hypothetical protein
MSVTAALAADPVEANGENYKVRCENDRVRVSRVPR